MRHPFFAASRPLVFAHRGGSALAPENTIAAFDNGLALGADGLELDVHLSRDGVVVVHHDRTLNRTTTLAGPIAERNADELRRAEVPIAGRSPRALQRRADHRRDEGQSRGARRGDDRRDPARWIGRSRLPRLVRLARAAVPRERSSHGLRRAPRARRSDGGSIDRGAAGRSLASATPASRCPSARGRRASSRRGSSTTRTAPGLACRCGPSMRKKTRGGCSAGASTP